MSDFTPLLEELDIYPERFGETKLSVFSQPSELPKSTLEALRFGDHDAYTTVFNAYYAPVKSFLAVMTRSDDTAQELTQEVFINLWEKRDKIDPNANIKGFLYTTAKFYMLNYFKRKNVILKYEQYKSRDIDFATSPDDIIIAKELSILIDIAISQMPKQQRNVLLLKYKQCKSNAEISEVLNISRETVKVYQTRGRNELRKVIVTFITLFMLQ